MRKKKQTVAPAMPTFVPPARREQPAPIIEMPPISVEPVWQGIADESRDSVSAQDRSKAFLIRNAPMYVVAVVIAVCVTILYTLAAWGIGVAAPYSLDRVLFFFASLAAFLFYTHMQSVKEDYDHSRAGVERLRIEAARDVAVEQLRSKERIQLAAFKQLTDKESDE